MGCHIFYVLIISFPICILGGQKCRGCGYCFAFRSSGFCPNIKNDKVSVFVIPFKSVALCSLFCQSIVKA